MLTTLESREILAESYGHEAELVGACLTARSNEAEDRAKAEAAGLDPDQAFDLK